MYLQIKYVILIRKEISFINIFILWPSNCGKYQKPMDAGAILAIKKNRGDEANL